MGACASSVAYLCSVRQTEPSVVAPKPQLMTAARRAETKTWTATSSARYCRHWRPSPRCLARPRGSFGATLRVLAGKLEPESGAPTLSPACAVRFTRSRWTTRWRRRCDYSRCCIPALQGRDTAALRWFVKVLCKPWSASRRRLSFHRVSAYTCQCRRGRTLNALRRASARSARHARSPCALL